MIAARAAVLAAVVAGSALPLPAQDPPGERTVSLTVVSAGDRSVYFDHGRDVGLRVGVLVRLFPPGAGEIEVEVRAVAQTSARADVPPGLPVPPVGTRGEARVAAASAPPPGQPANPTRPAVPEHPPWTRREDARTPDQPLLVPTFARRPDERPAVLDGRAFAFGQWNVDRAGDRDADYLLLRAGLRADGSNLLGAGERVRLAGEFDVRSVAVDGGDDFADERARLDLASVAFGTEAWAPAGIELGRFLSPHLPELGLVDGVEVVRRYQGGLRLGGGLGAYPLPFAARQTGDDFGAHLFADWTADAQRSFAATIGLQKTWHRGDPDRDLLLLRSAWRPAERVSLFGTAKVDWYGGSDTVKGRGAELTELLLQGRWDGAVLGTGLGVSHFAWPELRRDEYALLLPELVRDGYVDRLSWTGSWRVLRPLSLRGRADLWRDQQRNGTAFGLDADWTGLWSQGSGLSAAVFQNDGGYTSGPGARVQLRDRLGDVYWRAAYRWYRYDLDTLFGGAATLVRQSVELGASCPLGARGDLDLTAERWFGDAEDAFAFACYLQWRF